MTGNSTMGSICSSRRKRAAKQRTSLTSSSEVAVDVTRGRAAGGGAGVSSVSTGGNEALSTLPPKEPNRFRDDAEKSLSEQKGTLPTPGTTTEKPANQSSDYFTGSASMCPPCKVPECLRRVPEEMQNLLMGRWPVPPTPGSKCLRIFVAAEELDSQLERACLRKFVYQNLRVFTEEMGFHLHIVDIHELLPTRCIPKANLTAITRKTMNDGINIWLINLNNKLGWKLPTAIKETDFQEISACLKERNSKLADLLAATYQLDSNNIPPVYHCLPPSPVANELEQLKRQELFDALCDVVTEEQDELYMYEGFPEEVTTALDHHASMSDNIIVSRRNIFNLPKDKEHDACRKFLDINAQGQSHRKLMQKHSHLVARVEHVVANECILKWSVSWEEMEQSLLGVDTSYMKTMRTKVEEMLKAAVSRMIERRARIDPYLSAGLPPVLCQELLMHAHKQQHLLKNFTEPLPVVNTALERLHANPNIPLLLTGCVGSGLQTVASILALEEARRDAACMVALRYMTLTPESQSAMGALFTVLEQVTIGFGGHKVFKSLKCLSFSDILSAIAKCTGKESVTIIICSLRWPMLCCGPEEEWLPKTLPSNIRLIMLTCCPILCEKFESMAVGVPPMMPDQIEKFFVNRLAAENRCLTTQQHKEVMTALSKSLLPSLAVLMVELALEWTSDTPICSEDLPQTPDDALRHLFLQAEAEVGRACVSRIVTYLSIAKFGLSDSEMEDVLSIDDKLIASLYPSPYIPSVRACPLSIWLYVRHKFAPVMDVAYVYGHRVYRWQRQAVSSALVQQWYNKAVDFLSAHTQLADYFKGCWAAQPKPLPDHHSSTGRMVPCSVITQPNMYGRYVNCRKFLCLLHHTLEGLCTETQCVPEIAVIRDNAAKQHLLNVRWLVSKLDATSLVQLLDDLQVAMRAAQMMSTELSWLQLLVAQHAAELNVSGRQLHTVLNAQITADNQCKATTTSVSMLQKRRFSFNQAMIKFKSAVTNTSVPYFIYTDRFHKVSLALSDYQASSSITSSQNHPEPNKPGNCLNGIFTYRKNRSVVSISTGQGEIVVWDITNHTPVRILHDVNQPRHLVFLDDRRVVVLCNRELKAFDLETGELVTNIRGMLNIKMPYFHVRDPNTVIVLSRNRMSVNVLDVNSGQIHATFKAGEDRFLNSLLVSGNGNILVCGDETQKPFPLLVWELGQSKLLHDLRISQHEFITSIADITYDGRYIACACKGAYDSESNFVVVYDLSSGQLYRQFRLAAGSVTALAMASDSLAVILVNSDGSIAVYDIQSGNCKFNLSGINAIYNRIQLSKDEKQAVTYTVDAGMNPIACTVAYWDIHKGQFLASYTFDDPVTCCCHVDYNNTILVGLESLSSYLILSLFSPSAAAPSDDILPEVSFDQPLWKVT